MPDSVINYTERDALVHENLWLAKAVGRKFSRQYAYLRDDLIAQAQLILIETAPHALHLTGVDLRRFLAHSIIIWLRRYVEKERLKLKFVLDWEPVAPDSAIERNILERLHDIIRTDLRATFILKRRLEGHKFKDIAVEMGISAFTVTRLFKDIKRKYFKGMHHRRPKSKGKRTEC